MQLGAIMCLSACAAGQVLDIEQKEENLLAAYCYIFSPHSLLFTVLYCNVLYCVVLHCITLYCCVL